MDLTDILGGMLGRKPRKPGGAPGGRPGPAAPIPDDADIARQARELEDMLDVARGREAGRTSGRPQQPQGAPRTAPQSPPPPPAETPFEWPREGRPAPTPRGEKMSQNDQALHLVRAMVNAAKADGQLTAEEQLNIVRQFGGDEDEAVRFLRDEMAKPLDVREFAWSVPLGMEQQVYAMSLMAIDVDARAESDYLRDLAHGLRLPAEVCEQLHRRYAPGSVR
jgi:uncharacterized membrane protein YebE (DUF533 family)